VRIRTFRALVPRHPFVVFVVILLASTIGYDIKAAPRTYLESATVVFSAPKRLDNPASALSLISSGDVLVQNLTSPGSQRLIRDAGGTAQFNLALVNSSDEEYADYNYPFATLSAQSASPYAARRTFIAALFVLRELLEERQAQVGVPLRSRVSADVIADFGPVIQTGSSKRVFATLALLAVIAIAMTSAFLDRRRIRLGALLLRRRSIAPTSVINNDRPALPAQRRRADDNRVITSSRSPRHRASRSR
jgi:hypothetical protein